MLEIGNIDKKTKTLELHRVDTRKLVLTVEGMGCCEIRKFLFTVFRTA